MRLYILSENRDMAAIATTTISLPERLLVEIEGIARAQERTVSDLTSELLERYLREQEWRKLQAYGRERARALGIEEGDVDRLVAESRAERGV